MDSGTTPRLGGFSIPGRLPLSVCLLPVLLLVPVRIAGATTIRALGVEDLCRDATRILIGSVMSVRAHALGAIPASDITLEVSSTLKGAQETQVTFSVLGGTTSRGLRVDVDGESRFAAGEDVVVFLRENSASGRTWVVGGALGKYAVVGGCVGTTGMSLERFAAALRARLAGVGAVAIPSTGPEAGRTERASAPADSQAGPRVLRLDPTAMGSAGDTPASIRIFGRRFGAQPGRVLFPDWFVTVEGQVVDWSDTLVTVMAPQPDRWLRLELTSGPVQVVDARGRSSRDAEDPNCVGSCRPPSYLYVYYNYPRFRWAGSNGNRVSYRINPAGLPGDCGQDAIRRAFATWSANRSSNFRFVDDGITGATPGVHDGINAVGTIRPWPFDESWIAATIPWASASGDSMLLVEVDTGINTDRWRLTCAPAVYADADLETVMLHEAGHWLRLRHVSGWAEIMNVASLATVTNHSLGAGDRAGIAHIYPSHGFVEVERDSVLTCPAGDADSIVLAVTALDREGRPRAGLPPESTWAEADDRPAAGAAGLARIPASAATDSSGRTRIVLHDLVGGIRPRALRIQAGGAELAESARFKVFPLDLSGDGRVGAEDLAQAGDSGLAARQNALGGLSVERIRDHMGHAWPGLVPPTPPISAAPVAGLWISPNPSHAVADIRFSVAEAGPAQVDVIDLAGRRVRTLWSGHFESGVHLLRWDGRLESGAPAPSGLYIVRARQGARRFAQKLLRLHLAAW